MTNEIGVFRLIASKIIQKLACAGFRNSANIGNDFIARHANAVVTDGHRARLRIKRNANLQLGVGLKQRFVGQCLKAQLISSIRRIGNQFAQKNLLVAIQGVNHQLQQLFNLGLKSVGFFSGVGSGFTHLKTPIKTISYELKLNEGDSLNFKRRPHYTQPEKLCGLPCLARARDQQHHPAYRQHRQPYQRVPSVKGQARIQQVAAHAHKNSGQQRI